MGALTSEAKADDRVAEKIPAVIRGPKPETMLITLNKKKQRTVRLAHRKQLSITGTSLVPLITVPQYQSPSVVY